MNKEGQKSRKPKTKAIPAGLPEYCDYSCRLADFAPTESVGACRREQAVYCTFLRQVTRKNSHCAVHSH